MIDRIELAGFVDRGRFNLGGVRLGIEGSTISGLEECIPEGPWSDCIAVPGLIQTHIHLGQTLFRGMAEGRTLLPWLRDRIWPLEASHTPDTLAVSVIHSLRELFSSGCTGLLDMGLVENSRITVDILRRSGVRALAGNSLMDKGPEWIAREIGWLKEESERVRGACGGIVGYASVPRFALSCSDEVWSWMSDLPESEIRATHASESPDEINDPVIAAEGGNIRFLASRGFTGRRTLLAHCIHLQKGETEILRESGTTAVHCPWTNLRLGSGIADIPELHRSKVAVTVASDGAPCNNRLDLAGDLRLAMGLASIKAAPSFPASGFWFRSVTDSAAHSMGWQDTGRITGGFKADLVLLRPSPEEWEELRLCEDPVRYVLELPWSSRVELTMIDGKVVYGNGDFPTLPEMPMTIGDARRMVLDRACELPGNTLKD